MDADPMRGNSFGKPLEFGGRKENEMGKADLLIGVTIPQAESPIGNFHCVREGRLYRSAQPTKAGMKWAKEFGIKTVVNLRHWHTDTDEIGKTKLRAFHIVFATMWPETRDVRRFLKIVRNKKNWPILVHCLHGSDRTGMMCAFYRLEVEFYRIEDAIEEMRLPKYGHHRLFVHLPRFVRKLFYDNVL